MHIYITIGGQGSRLKSISPLDKHLLYMGRHTIIEHILSIFPTAILLGNKKTNSRKETLQEIKNKTDCLIVDCDVIPVGIGQMQFDENTLFYFQTQKKKYGSIIIENGRLHKANEKENISNDKCSGIYYIKSMQHLLESMTDENSIASGMIGAKVVEETTFVRVGDVEDYYEAL